MSDNGRSISMGEALNNALSEISANNADALRSARLYSAWKKVAEEPVLEHTDHITIYKDGDKTFVDVYMDFAIWAADLNAQSERYRVRLQNALGQGLIHRIQFKTSVINSRHKAFKMQFLAAQRREEKQMVEPALLSAEELAEINEHAAMIKNDEVREALVKAWTDDLAWKKGVKTLKTS